MLHRQINRPVITEICRLLEARRIQATLARENTNILGALVARQPIDVGDDLVFLSSGFDKFLRFVTDLVQQSSRFVHRAELPPSLYQPLRHDHRIASFPAHVRQRAFHFLQLRQRETAAGIHQADLCLFESLFFEQFRAVGADLVRRPHVFDPSQRLGERHVAATDIEQKRNRAVARHHRDAAAHFGKIIGEIAQIGERIIIPVDHQRVQFLPRHFTAHGIETQLEFSLRDFFRIPSGTTSFQNGMAAKYHLITLLRPERFETFGTSGTFGTKKFQWFQPFQSFQPINFITSQSLM